MKKSTTKRSTNPTIGPAHQRLDATSLSTSTTVNRTDRVRSALHGPSHLLQRLERELGLPAGAMSNGEVTRGC